MTELDQDLDVYQGSDVLITVTVYESDGYTADVITGWDLEATFAKPVSRSIDTTLTKTIGDGVTITNGAGGVCTVALEDTDTDEMDAGEWEWSLWRIDDGSEAPLAIGTLTIIETARSRSST